MEPTDPAIYEAIARAFFGLGSAALLVGVLGVASDERPGGFWILGWASILYAGSFYASESGGWTGAQTLGMWADAVFAPLMWMGALALHRSGRPPWWPLLAAGVVGLLRVTLESHSMDGLGLLLAATVAPGFFLAAARSTWQAAPEMWFRQPIAALFTAFAAFEVMDAYADWSGGANDVAYGSLAILGLPLATFQIASRIDALRRGVVSAQAASDAAERRRDIERSHFHEIFDEVKELVVELDPDTRVLFVNARVRDILGLDPDAIIGTTALSYLPEELRFEAEELWRVYRKAGGVDHLVTYEMPDARGERVVLEINISERMLDGERRYLVLARDVTARKGGQERLEARQRDLEASIAESRAELSAYQRRLEDQERLAAVGTLASGIAHQINNPLGGILAAAEFALLEADARSTPPVVHDALTRIGEEARRAGRIVKGILRFARQGATPKWLDDLVPVVRRSAELARDYVSSRGGRLEIECAETTLPVLMSPVEVEQLVENLVHNAAESRDRGARVRVSVAPDPTARFARIEVHDDGRGIPPEAVTEVFGPFYTTRIQDGGSGLGLSVARAIVEDHGGTIEIESQPRRGTTVTVDLPLRERS